MAWKIYLCRSTDMARYGEFVKMSQRQLVVRLNQGGSFTGVVSMDDNLAATINPVTTAIQCVQDGVVRWSGPIINAKHYSSGHERTVTIQAVGWFELLNHRNVRDNTVDYPTTFITNPSFPDSTTGLSGWTNLLNATWSNTQAHSAGGSCLFTDASGGLDAGNITSPTFTSPIGAVCALDYWYYVPNVSKLSDIEPYVNQNGVTVSKDFILAASVTAGVWTNARLTWVGDGTPTFIGLASRASQTAVNGDQWIFFDDAYIYQEQGVWGPLDIGETALRLVDYANNRWSCPVTRGTANISWNRNAEYRPFQNIGQEIKRLSDVENGFDFEVDPSTRKLNIYWPYKGTFKASYDSSLRAHTKAGAQHLWQFDTGTSDADSISGSPVSTAYSIANSLQFSGSGHCSIATLTGGSGVTALSLHDNVDMAIGANYTLSCLFQIDTMPSSGKNLYIATDNITLASSKVNVRLDSTGAITFRVGTSNEIATGAGKIIVNQPFHLVCSYDANQQRAYIYINAVLVAVTPSSSTIVSAQTGATFGSWLTYESGGTGTIIGRLDEVGMWRGRCLNATEVFNLYNVLRTATGKEVESVKFGYGSRGPSNLVSISRTNDASWMTNFFIAQGQGSTAAGGAVALDLASMVTYGEWNEVGQASEIRTEDVLSSYAMAEVGLRGRPRVLYEWKPLRTPVQTPGRVSIPRPFIDYVVGDIVSFDALDGTIDADSETARVFGIRLTLDENGNEDVTIETSLGGSS